MPRPRKSPGSEKRAALAVYLPRNLLKKLQKVADRDYRSASAQALLFIERALEAERR
jgi:CopG-like RHH_1 or ribbon-helix-helix domain, RHH_5